MTTAPPIARHSPEYLALSPRRQRFTDAMQVEATYGAAALAAGYADVKQGSRLAKDDEIIEALRAEREITALAVGVTPGFVLGRLTVLAEYAKAERDQIRALELIGKATGMFVKRVEVTGVIAHIPALPGMTDEDLTDLVAELRARRDSRALPAGDADGVDVEASATVVDEARDGEGSGGEDDAR